MCELWDAVTMRKVGHKTVDVKYVQANVLKQVARIGKGRGGIKPTRPIGNPRRIG